MQDPIGAAMIPSSTYLNPTADDEKQPLKCPRCESTNTKFCYYNNYNLLQPRHFCKDCRRYWTKGGALRNVPVGGGTRKNSKRSATSAAAGGGASNPKRPSLTPPKPEPIRMIYPPIDQDEGMLGISGSFSSLLASADSNFDNLMDTRISTVGLQSSNDSSENPMLHPVNFLGFQGDSGCWAGGWPELAIYTPGPRFQ